MHSFVHETVKNSLCHDRCAVWPCISGTSHECFSGKLDIGSVRRVPGHDTPIILHSNREGSMWTTTKLTAFRIWTLHERKCDLAAKLQVRQSVPWSQRSGNVNASQQQLQHLRHSVAMATAIFATYHGSVG